MRDAAVGIRQGRFQVVWIDIPSARSPGKQFSFATILATLALGMRDAQTAQVVGVLIGVRGARWQSESLAALLAD